jgi:hypothetical protein
MSARSSAASRAGRAAALQSQVAAAQVALALTAAHQGPQPGLELLQVEGLGEVVVGAGVQPRHALAHRPAGGEHQHRGRVIAAAQPRQHLQTVDVGQREVEHEGVEAPPLAQGQRLQAVAAGNHGEPARRQRAPQRLHQAQIVLDQQHVHRPKHRTGGAQGLRDYHRGRTKGARKLASLGPGCGGDRPGG